MSVSICIVTYNSMKYLPYFLDSVFHQTYWQKSGETPDVFVVDNASGDKTVNFIRDNFPTVHLLRNINNIGLSRAWNQAIKMTRGDYLLVMNPDLILEEKFLATLVSDLAEDDHLAAAGGKLYRLDFESEGGFLVSPVKTNILDSCGLRAFKNRRFVDRGAGELDRGQLDVKEEVFGLSGACLLLRRSALEAIKFGEEYFDENFFMYQEDIDLAWRLRLAGWSALYDPLARGWHHRRAQSGQKNDWAVIRYRRGKENLVNFHSYKNHLMLLYKNELWANVLPNLPSILWYELKKFVYVLIFEVHNFFRGWAEIFKNRHILKKKRGVNMRQKKVRAEEMRRWFQ